MKKFGGLTNRSLFLPKELHVSVQIISFSVIGDSYLGVVILQYNFVKKEGKKEKKSDRVCSCSKKMAAKVV